MSIKTSVFANDGTSPGAVVRRMPEEHEMEGLMQYLATELGFLEAILDPDKMAEKTPEDEWIWDDYQKAYFNVRGSYICNKCRQSGGSAKLSAKFFAKGNLAETNYNAILTSYKKEEAINKIDYVRSYLEALPPSFRKTIIRDPLQLIEFENPNKTRVKIISHPQKPIRGINGDVGLDELAFYQWAEEVYASALPATGMSRSTIDIISTPFGMSGTFYEIFADREKYPQYTRFTIMWWYCSRYLKSKEPAFMALAARLAPTMPTSERVYAFGNNFLIQQYENALDEETFQQEFEGLFVDEQAAFFSKKLIYDCLYDNETDIDDYNPLQSDVEDISIEDAFGQQESDLSKVQREFKGKSDTYGRPIHFERYVEKGRPRSLQKLYRAVRNGKISGNLFAGFDVGTTRHSSHLIIFEEIHLGEGQTLQVERFSLNKQNWPLPDQEEFLRQILMTGVVKKINADCTGIGMQMGQALSKQFPVQFKAFQMGGNNKLQEDMMVNLKTRMEAGYLALYNDKRNIEDLYAIERVVTDSRGVRFKADEKGRHHADAAWAIAMGSYAGSKVGSQTVMTSSSLNLMSASNFSPLSRAEREVTPRFVERVAGGMFGLGLDNFSSDFGSLINEGSPGHFNSNWDE